MNHRVLYSVASFAGSLLTACGEQHTPPAATPIAANAPAALARAQETAKAPRLDACALITQADADAILGVPGKLSEHAADDRFTSHCSYESADATSGFNGFGIEIGSNADAQEAKTSFAIKQQLYSNYTIYHYELLPDIGDAAFLAVSKVPDEFKTTDMSALIAHQQILMAIKSTKAIDITTSYFGTERTTGAVQTIARKLAAHF
jgi:hypothetical protein